MVFGLESFPLKSEDLKNVLMLHVIEGFIYSMCVFISSVCDSGIFTCSNVSCDGEFCDITSWTCMHCIRKIKNITFKISQRCSFMKSDVFRCFSWAFQFPSQWCLYRLRSLKVDSIVRNVSPNCTRLNRVLSTFVSERCCCKSTHVVCLCVSGLWMEQLVCVELVFSVMWIWTSVLQSDGSERAAVRRTGMWGTLKQNSNLPWSWMRWVTQTQHTLHHNISDETSQPCNSHVECPDGEHWLWAVTGSERVCERGCLDMYRPEALNCRSHGASEGCVCEEGLYRSPDGRCVIPALCQCEDHDGTLREVQTQPSIHSCPFRCNCFCGALFICLKYRH